jgi:hypothetical protein
MLYAGFISPYHLVTLVFRPRVGSPILSLAALRILSESSVIKIAKIRKTANLLQSKNARCFFQV